VLFGLVIEKFLIKSHRPVSANKIAITVVVIGTVTENPGEKIRQRWRLRRDSIPANVISGGGFWLFICAQTWLLIIRWNNSRLDSDDRQTEQSTR
jgi:hypothetical protein